MAKAIFIFVITLFFQFGLNAQASEVDLMVSNLLPKVNSEINYVAAAIILIESPKTNLKTKKRLTDYIFDTYGSTLRDIDTQDELISNKIKALEIIRETIVIEETIKLEKEERKRLTREMIRLYLLDTGIKFNLDQKLYND